MASNSGLRTLKGVVLLFSPVITALWNPAHEVAGFGTKCEEARPCPPPYGKWCQELDNNCTCKNDHTRFRNLCIQKSHVEKFCFHDLQCQAHDKNSHCMTEGHNDEHRICQCKQRYEINRKDMSCYEKYASNPYNSPFFDSRDTVPIVMGCLAAGLALVACCAGIVQLVRKKQRFRSGAPSPLGNAGTLTLCNTIPHPGSGDGYLPPPPPPIEDLPPSYEEAIKDSQIIPSVPFTEEKPEE